MEFFRSAFAKASYLLFIVLFVSSCKENSLVRTDVVPAVDNITVFATDTLTLLTKTIQEDTVITNAYSSGSVVYAGAGNITFDPYFGKTNASFYFQVRPPQDNFTIDQSKYQIDSAVLVLPYSGFVFGDTNSSAGSQTFKAYRMQEQIFFDSIYYAHTASKNIESNPFATLTVSIADLVKTYRDSVSVAGVKRPAHIRMKVSNELVDALKSKLGASEYANNAAFMAYFNGIYITTETGGNSIPYFRLTGDDIYTKAGIVMYYHTINSGGSITDTLTASYPFDPSTTQTKTGFFSKVTRDFSGAAVQSLFTSTAQTDNTVAIQSLPGATLELSIPHVKNLPKCIVNKAELVLTQIASPLDILYQSPARIYPIVVDEYGNKNNIADRLPVSSTAALYFIDGNARMNIVDGTLVNQYVLNLPRELQDAIVEQRKALKLRINSAQTFIGAYRVTLAGSQYSKPAFRAKLNVVYTKL